MCAVVQFVSLCGKKSNFILQSKFLKVKPCGFSVTNSEMSVFHDEIEIEDFEYDEEEDTYYYPCPCGDRFQITKDELLAGEEVATCPSCSLVIKVIYDLDAFQQESEEVDSITNDIKKLAVA